jgi:hypothetical protein
VASRVVDLSAAYIIETQPSAKAELTFCFIGAELTRGHLSG